MRSRRGTTFAAVTALLAGLLTVLVPAGTAAAAGTLLFDNTFANNTVNGTGTVTVPAPVTGTNVACLTASGNTTTGPLLSCSGATDTQGSGKLRMTAATGGQVGGVFGGTSFPTSNGLDVTFNSYQWGGNGADGLSFVLAAVDPANPVVPSSIGSSGGALGYSAAPGVAGLADAYLGVGLDVFGNFSNSSYQGSGCTSVPNIGTAVGGAVVVRGPGNGTVGYCGLTTTYNGTTGSKLTLRAATRAAAVVPVQVLINPTATTYTSSTGVSAAPGTYKVVVTPVGGTAKTLTGTLPTVSGTLYPSSTWLNAAGVPKQLAFGFVGSTGSVYDDHEISNARVLTFNPVPQLAVSSTSYAASSVTAGGPVTYSVSPSVQSGADENSAVSVTQTVPAGVTPLGAYGSGWTCAAPSGQTITCTSTATSWPNGTTLPSITVVGVATTTVTSAAVQSGSPVTVSSSDGSPATASTTVAGTVATAPSGLAISPSSGLAAGGGTVTLNGSDITGATAIEIGTTSEQQSGKPTTLFPCTATVTTGCFTVNGANLTINGMPAHAAGAVSVTVVSQGAAGAVAYTYLDRPATPAAPTATAGTTSATVTWTAPANNGATITGYTVTPYLNGVAQAPVTFDATTTTRTFTGLTRGASYTFTVAATNAYGTSNASPASNAVVPYTLPGAPAITAVTAGDSQATLTWSAPADTGSTTITGYVVTAYVNGVVQASRAFAGTTTTRTFTGLTPGVAYTFTVAAQNAAGTGPASAASAAVTPNDSPSLTFPVPPAGEVGVAYTDQLTVTNGTAPFSWSIASGSLPPGLTLGATTGLLSGTPTTAGTYTYVVQVTDASGLTATKSVTTTIAAAPSMTFSPPAGELGVAYTAKPTLTGGTAPITYAITAGSIPAGLALDTATGTISGTPTAAGTSTFTITATDAFGQTTGKTVPVTVAARPSITTTPPSGQVGVAYSTTFDVTGGTSPYTWALTAGSLPPGLTLNTSTGAVSGVPLTAGGYPVTITATDAFGQTATRSTSITIGAGPIVITKSANVSSAAPGSTVTYTITVANTALVPFASVNLSDPLAAVLDDATYSGNATATSGTLTYASGTLGWSGSLAGGATVTISYQVVVQNPDPGNKVLANTVSSTTLGTNCAAGSGDSRCTATVGVPGFTIVKSADVTTTVPGGTVSYTITVTNSGQTALPAATFTDGLAGVLDDATYAGDAAATTGAVGYANATLTWTGSLAVGASATITYKVRVSDPDPGDRALTGTVVSPVAGSTCPSTAPAAQCSSTVTVLVPALAITDRANTATTTPGGTVGYTVTIANTGQTPYPGASVAIGLSGALDDAAYNGDAIATSGAVRYAAPTLTWTGDLPLGGTVTVTYSVTTSTPDPGDRTITTVASSTAAGSTCPPGSTNAACTSAVQVLIPALTITKSADTATTTPGSTVRYTVVVTNSGQTPYTGATAGDDLTGVLDDATYNGDAATTAGGIAYRAPVLTWTGDLAIGATATITYSVTVATQPAGDRSLANTVTSTAVASTCPAAAPAAQCTSTVPVLIPRLSFDVHADVTTTTPGGVVRHTFTVTNSGQTRYTGIIVTIDGAGAVDDADYDNDIVMSTGAIVGGGDTSLYWQLDLAPGATATATLTTPVHNPDPGDHIVQMSASSPAPGSTCLPGSTAPSCVDTVTVLEPGLTITKTANSTAVTPGDPVTYTVVVVNTGQTTYAPATFTDDLGGVLTDAVYPAGATATTGTVGYTAPVLSWSGTLAPGQSATISYSVTVRDPDPGDKHMSNTVVSPAAGSNCPAGGGDPRCTAAVTVLVPSLTITTSAGGATTTPGATLGRTVTITNTGATAYTGATVTDSLSGLLDDAGYVGDAAATSGTVRYTNGVLTWTGDLAVGASATVTYSVLVHEADTGDDLVTDAVTSAARGTNCAAGGTDPRCSTTTPVARLLLRQSYVDSYTTPGAVARLNATFTNTGQVPYTGISITSPAGGTVDDATPNGDQTASSGSLVLTSNAITWTGSIPVGGTVTVTGTLTVHNPDTGDRVLTGTLSSTAPGNNCPAGTADPQCTARLPVLVPGLTLTKTASTTATVPGATVGYTITVTNSGETPQPAAAFTDTLTGVLDDATYNGDATATTGTLTPGPSSLAWTGSLAVGATATIGYTVTVRPVPGDKILVNPVESATAGSTCPPASGNAACVSTVAVLTPAVTLTKTADLPNATLGSTVTYTVKVANTGQTPYPAVSFTDSLAGVLDDATYDGDASASAGSLSYVDGVLGWSGPLALGASATITYSVTIHNPDTGDRSMANTVVSSAAGSNCAAGSTDTRCTATVAVTNATSLTITKTADVAATAAGKRVTYTVTATNSSILPIAGATLADPLAGIVDDADYNGDATASVGTVSYAGTTLSWLGTLGAGATATITYSVTVHATVTGDQVLNGTVSSTTLLTSDNCPVGSADPRCTSTVPVAALVIEQHYTEPYGTPGGLVHLSTTFTNTGKYDYQGITISSPTTDGLDDSIPIEQSASSGTLVLGQGVIVWTGDIPVGATVTLAGTLTIKDPPTGNRVLDGTISTDALGSNCPAGGSDTRCRATLRVLVPGLAISKSASATYTVPGGTVTYTVTINDSGETPYSAATVTDSLSGLLDDADYNGDATASSGAVRFTGQDLVWTGDLAVGATATVHYSVTAHRPPTGDKTMVNPVWSTEAGSSCTPATGDPACRTTVAVLTPAVQISASADTATAVPGQAVVLTVTATNTGQTPYPSVTVRVPLADVLDDAHYAGDAAATSGSVQVTAGTLTWTGALATGASATITYSVTVDRPDTGNHRLVQTAVSGDAGSTCPAGGTDPRCAGSVPIADLVITNTTDVATAAPRSTVRHTVTLVNVGQVPFVGITADDALAGAIDDADYGGDAGATSGSLTLNPDTATISWTGDIPVGGAVTVSGTVTVRYPDPGDQVLTTAVSTGAPGSNCPVGGTDPRCRTSVRVLTPGLTITKSADQTTVTPGGTVGYTIVITDTGETSYRSAVVTDSLIGALADGTYLDDAAATTGSVDYAAPTLTWTGDLAPGQQVVLTYHLRVDETDLGPRLLYNTVASEDMGSTCSPSGGSSGCAVFVTVLVPQLDVTVTADRDTTVPGATVGYTVTVANTGQTPYTGATVRLELGGVLDDAAYNDDATTTAGTVTSEQDSLLWTGDLAVGATAVIAYTVTVADPDTGDLRLVTSAVSTDPGSTCGTGCANTVTVLIPGLSVSTTTDRDTATPGDRVVYTITVHNTGQTPYSDLTVTSSLADVLDDATFDGTVTASSGAASYQAPTVTWTGNLAVGTTATISYAVVVRSPDPGDRRMSATALAPAAGSSCRPSDPAPACTGTTTVLVPRLSITKSAESPTTTPGSVVRYRIVVANTGETAYPAATVRDSLDNVLFDADYNGDATVLGGGTLGYTDGTLSWTGPLPVGSSAVIAYSITVHDPDTGDRSMVNTATSADPGSTCPPDAPAPDCRATVQVLEPALDITKVADTTTVVAGGAVHYRVTVTNTGETPYVPATVADSLRDVLDDADYAGDATASTGAVAYSAGTITWTGGLDLGQSVVITYSVVTRYPADGDHALANAVTSPSPGASCRTGTEDGCHTTVALLVPHLAIALSADQDTVVAGGSVRYTITATNTGEADYPAAELADPLSGVLDDAVYAGDATASSGTVTYADGTLSWNGPVPRGTTVTITFSVKVDVDPSGDLVLSNSVSSPATGATCDPTCTTTTQVIARFLTLTGLTPSFTLGGLPGATVDMTGAVTMTVTTNSTTGYSVVVRPLGPSLVGPGGSFPVDRMGVRETGGGTYQPLSPDAPVMVHSQQTPSAPGGDAVSNDYRVQVPDVPSGTYTTTLEYIAGTL